MHSGSPRVDQRGFIGSRLQAFVISKREVVSFERMLAGFTRMLAAAKAWEVSIVTVPSLLLWK